MSFEELKYISEKDFRKWPGVGQGTVDYVCRKMEENGLCWGEYTYKYYKEHFAEVDLSQVDTPIPELPSLDGDMAYFRKSTAKEIMAHLAASCFGFVPERLQSGITKSRWKTACTPEILAKEAVELADALVKELKKR